jgi:hypothetical protein
MLLVIFLAWLSFNSMSYLSTLVFQEVQRTSAAKTSVLFLPMVGSALVLNTVAGYLVARVAAVWLIVFGAAMGAAACAILAAGTTPETPYYAAMLWVVLLQVGPDIFFPAGNLYACKAVGRQHQALAGSLFNTTIRISTSLGLALTSAIATAVTKHSNPVAPYSPVALLRGYRAASILCASSSLLALFIAVARLRSIGIVGASEAKSEDPTPSPEPASPHPK